MKLSWGYRVTILYISFAGLIIYFVTRSMKEKIELVTPDYYAQELEYQNKIESINRNNSLNQPLSIDLTTSGVSVKFPGMMSDKPMNGSIVLFRPSDKSKDRTIPINPNANFEQLIPVSELAKGMYRVKVEYESGGQTYYSEKQIVIR